MSTIIQRMQQIAKIGWSNQALWKMTLKQSETARQPWHITKHIANTTFVVGRCVFLFPLLATWFRLRYICHSNLKYIKKGGALDGLLVVCRWYLAFMRSFWGKRTCSSGCEMAFYWFPPLLWHLLQAEKSINDTEKRKWFLHKWSIRAGLVAYHDQTHVHTFTHLL